MLDEQLRVQERQLDRVADGLDLGAEAADVAVVDVRHLLQDQLLDLCLRHALIREAGPGVDGQGVTDPQRAVQQRRGQAHDAFLVGPGGDQGTVTADDLLQGGELTDPLKAGHRDDVHRLVEHDLAARDQLLRGHGRGHRDPDLSPGGHDVGAAVVDPGQQGAVGGGGLGEPVHLRTKRDDLLSCLTQGAGEALILQRDAAGLGPRPRHLVLQPTHAYLVVVLVHVASLRSAERILPSAGCTER